MPEHEFKPGDTVDPRTLPVGAEFRHVGHAENVRMLVVVAGKTAVMVGDFDHGQGRYNISGTAATVLSLSQPIADEPVDLGTLAKNDHFELVELPPGFSPQWLGALVKVLSFYPSGAVDVTIARPAVPGGYRSSAVLTEATKVLRRPAPTPAQQPSGRPPCDACGEESCEDLDGQFVVDGSDAAVCSGCYYDRNSSRVIDDVRARRAKTSGSGNAEEHAESSPVVRKRPEPEDSKPRWQTTDPTRIAALEAKLAGQVASGGQDCKAARSLIERADDLRREAERYELARSANFAQWNDGACTEVLRSGPRLMRHELPESQRASYKSQSTDRKRAGR